MRSVLRIQELVVAQTVALSCLVNSAFGAEGVLTAWGHNIYGESSAAEFPPVYIGLGAGNGCTFGIRSDGTLLGWGRNAYGQCDLPADLGTVTQVVVGGDHVVALQTGGTVRSWGRNQAGETVVPADLGVCVRVGAGSFHSIAITQAGTVRCWGAGSGTPFPGISFNQCIVPADLGPCIEVGAGAYHTLAIKADGTFRAWGYSNYGLITPPAGVTSVIGVAGGLHHTVVIQPNGTVKCWGNAADGATAMPTDLGPCTRVAAGYRHSVVLTASGFVRTWGNNVYGQAVLPAFVGRADKIACGYFHSAALLVEDCNGNSVVDGYELDGQDCNQNLVPDDCDEALGWFEDCNDNGFADSCETEHHIDAQSEMMGPIGTGSPQVWTIANAATAISNVELRIRARGDFGGEQEYIHVRLGRAVVVQALANTVDCSSGTGWHSFLIPYETFTQAIEEDGTLTIAFEPSVAVDPMLCATGTWIQAELSYQSPLSGDCNSNGALDSCEIAAGSAVDANRNGIIDTCESAFTSCVTDLNADGHTDGADLGLLLGEWGDSGNLHADLDFNGVVDGADLGILLGSWGTCS